MPAKECLGLHELSGISEFPVSELQTQASALMFSGIQESTRATYTAPQKLYLQFCNSYGLQPLPAVDDTLILFATYMFNKGLSYNTCKVYISAVVSLHTFSNVTPPNLKNPRFRLIMRSISLKSQGHNQKSPITFVVLQSIWQTLGNMKQANCLKAAISLGFFGGLRGSEYLKTPFNEGPKMTQLTFISDSCLKFTVTKSKTKPHGFTLPFHCSKHQICAVCCMKTYLLELGSQKQVSHDDYLFQYDNTQLSKFRFNSLLKQVMQAVGQDPNRFSTHSLRSGVTTTAAHNKFRDWELKQIGGWGTNTYTTYIRSNTRNSSRFAQRLTQKR